MRFEQPAALLLLILVPVFGAMLLFLRMARRRRLRSFVSQDVLPRLLLGASPGRAAGKAILRLAGIAMIILALARPQWGRKDEPVVRRGVDVALAFDLSSSMLAEDVSPSRLEGARAEAVSLLGSLTGDRVALVVFGGRATVQCPLTLDYGAVRMFLDAAEPDVSPGPGSDLGRAIEESARLFTGSERRYKTIVLLTDGEDLEGHGVAAAKKAAAEGTIIHAIGVGTRGGGPIPLRDDNGTITGYKKDREGRVVTTRFDPESLAAITSATGGTYLTAGPIGEEGRKIADVIAAMEKKEVASRLATRYEDRFQWPLAVGLVLLGIEAAWIGRRARGSRRPAQAEPSSKNPRGAKLEGTTAAAALGIVSIASMASLVSMASMGAIGSLGVMAMVCTAGMTPARAQTSAAPPAFGSAPSAQSDQREKPNTPAPTANGADPSEKRQAHPTPQAPATAIGVTPPKAAPAKAASPPSAATPPKATLPEPAPSRAVAQTNRDANRMYGRQQFADALSRYEQASAAAPQLPSLRYNIGNALYRQGKYEEAASEYQRSLGQAGPALAPAAAYNLGNAQYQQKRYDQAAEAYLKTLQQNPKDEDARRNLELALRMLEQEQQKQQQQQNQQQQQQGKGQPDKKPQSGKDQPPQNDEKNDPSGQQKTPQDPGQQNQAPRSGEGKLDRKEAERLLNSLAQEEKQDLKKRLARQPREEGPEKDW